MRDVEVVTARGRGHWYHDYEFELLTRSVTRWDAAGSRSQTIETWEVRIDDERVGSRGFSAAEERDTFLASQFTDVAITPVEPPIESERAHVMAECVDAEVSSVTYVQLRLNAAHAASYPTLTLNVWPLLERGHTLIRRGDPGYLDAMVGLIGSPLRSVDELLDLGLVLEFANGHRLIVPLDGSGLVEAEVAEFAGNERGMIWRPGDEPIDWTPPTSR